jgi:hypothetical protein
MDQQRIGSPGGSFGGSSTTGSMSNNPSSFGDGSLQTSNFSSSSEQASTASLVKEQGGRALDKLRETAVSKVEDQKTMASEQVGNLASSLRRTGETLQREGAEPFGRVACTAADQVQRVASYLDRSNVDTMMRDVRELARRNPTVVFGTAILAGVLLGRFLRSSSEPDREVVFTPDPSLVDESSGLSTGGSSLGGSSLGGSSLGDSSLGGSTLGGSTLGGSNFGGNNPPTGGGWA